MHESSSNNPNKVAEVNVRKTLSGLEMLSQETIPKSILCY